MWISAAYGCFLAIAIAWVAGIIIQHVDNLNRENLRLLRHIQATTGQMDERLLGLAYEVTEIQVRLEQIVHNTAPPQAPIIDDDF